MTGSDSATSEKDRIMQSESLPDDTQIKISEVRLYLYEPHNSSMTGFCVRQ